MGLNVVLNCWTEKVFPELEESIFFILVVTVYKAQWAVGNGKSVHRINSIERLLVGGKLLFKLLKSAFVSFERTCVAAKKAGREDQEFDLEEISLQLTGAWEMQQVIAAFKDA
ncbi:MAG: hypothetical protein D3910_26815 [Candidatus Electrothrix sp. ATG2]|nr:hypothetical protein [Candidatus Electrothrix sp. ATG2]